MNTYRVVTAQGETITIEADEVELDPTGMTVTFFADEQPVGVFRSYSSFHVLEPEAP